MGSLIGAVSGVADRRLLTTTLVPVLAFLVGLAAVIAAGIGWSAAARWWTAMSTEIRILQTLLVLIVVLLLTQLLAARRASLIRLYEGYWQHLPWGARLAEQRKKRHVDIHRSLKESDPRWVMYPVREDQVMPTAIGNVLRGAEEHSADRYAITAVTAWPRLYPTLPEPFRLTFAAAASDFELAITLSALGVVFTAVAGVLGAFLLPWFGTLLCLVLQR